MAKRLDKEIEMKIIEAYNNGNSSVQISKEYKIAVSTICRVLKRYEIKARSNEENSRRYFLNERYFEKIDNEHKAYWLGFMYADGFVTKDNKFGISLKSDDKFHLKKFLKDLESSYPINKYTSSGYSNGEYVRVLMSSKKVKNDLIKHGCVEHKTDILKAPILDEKLYRHFIRGYIDGDGCITLFKNSKGNDIRSSVKILGTVDVLDFIKTYIESNTNIIINQYYKKRESHTVECLEFGGNEQVRIFLDLIYEDATIYLERKYEKYIDLCLINNFSRSRKKFRD